MRLLINTSWSSEGEKLGLGIEVRGLARFSIFFQCYRKLFNMLCANDDWLTWGISLTLKMLFQRCKPELRQPSCNFLLLEIVNLCVSLLAGEQETICPYISDGGLIWAIQSEAEQSYFKDTLVPVTMALRSTTAPQSIHFCSASGVTRSHCYPSGRY